MYYQLINFKLIISSPFGSYWLGQIQSESWTNGTDSVKPLYISQVFFEKLLQYIFKICNKGLI